MAAVHVQNSKRYYTLQLGYIETSFPSNLNNDRKSSVKWGPSRQMSMSGSES